MKKKKLAKALVGLLDDWTEKNDMMDEDDIRAAIKGRGYEVDEGILIDGPFIPDGTVRIHDPETSSIKGSGDTLREAYEDARGMLGW